MFWATKFVCSHVASSLSLRKAKWMCHFQILDLVVAFTIDQPALVKYGFITSPLSQEGIISRVECSLTLASDEGIRKATFNSQPVIGGSNNSSL